MAITLFKSSSIFLLLVTIGIMRCEPALAQERGAQPDLHGVILLENARNFELEPAPSVENQTEYGFEDPDTEADQFYDWQLDEKRIRKRETSRAIIFQVLNAVDAVQTIACIESGSCYELNPIYGRYPSKRKVIGLKAVSGGVHALTSYALSHSDNDAAAIFQLATIALIGGAVAWNLQYSF